MKPEKSTRKLQISRHWSVASSSVRTCEKTRVWNIETIDVSLHSLVCIHWRLFLFEAYFGLKLGVQKLLISRNMIQDRHLKEGLN